MEDTNFYHYISCLNNSPKVFDSTYNKVVSLNAPSKSNRLKDDKVLANNRMFLNGKDHVLPTRRIAFKFLKEENSKVDSYVKKQTRKNTKHSNTSSSNGTKNYSSPTPQNKSSYYTSNHNTSSSNIYFSQKSSSEDFITLSKERCKAATPQFTSWFKVDRADNVSSRRLKYKQAISDYKSLASLDIFGNWKVVKKIGHGSFGDVFLAQGAHTANRNNVAIKYERPKTNSYLKNEAEIYQLIKEFSCVPKLYYYDVYSDNRYLVMELLGPSLDHLVNSQRRLRLSAVIDIGLQMLDILKLIHSKNIAFRDVKPSNFLLSSNTVLSQYSFDQPKFTKSTQEFYFEPQNSESDDNLPFFNDLPILSRPNPPKLYIVDFGLSESMSDPSMFRELAPGGFSCGHAGTAMYASIATHQGYNSGPLDDLESVIYVLIELLYGKLPWEDLVEQSVNSSQKWGLLKKAKESISFEDVFFELPGGFEECFHAIRRFPRNKRPDYQLFRDNLEEMLFENQTKTTSESYAELFD